MQESTETVRKRAALFVRKPFGFCKHFHTLHLTTLSKYSSANPPSYGETQFNEYLRFTSLLDLASWRIGVTVYDNAPVLDEQSSFPLGVHLLYLEAFSPQCQFLR